jgi:hypothetical protein
VDIANHRVSILRDTLTYFRGSFIDCSNADQTATRVYPHAIFRISTAHHAFALHRIELDENLIKLWRMSSATVIFFSPIFFCPGVRNIRPSMRWTGLRLSPAGRVRDYCAEAVDTDLYLCPPDIRDRATLAELALALARRG